MTFIHVSAFPTNAVFPSKPSTLREQHMNREARDVARGASGYGSPIVY